MAYMNQEKKAKLVPNIKAVLKKYGAKATVSVENYVENYSTLIVTISESPFDFIGMANEYNRKYAERTYQRPYIVQDYLQLSPHCFYEYEGIVKDFLLELNKAMNNGNHNNSDIMSDYFDVGWYNYINIGRWNKPYKISK